MAVFEYEVCQRVDFSSLQYYNECRIIVLICDSLATSKLYTIRVIVLTDIHTYIFHLHLFE